VIPLSSTLRRTLVEIPRLSNWVFAVTPPSDRTATDSRLSDRRALAHLKTVLMRLGLRGHLHTFRHSFISHALTSGVPVAIVRKWVGHVDAKTIDLYTHVADKISQSQMDRLFGEGPDEAETGHENHKKLDPKRAQNVHRKER